MYSNTLLNTLQNTNTHIYIYTERERKPCRGCGSQSTGGTGCEGPQPSPSAAKGSERGHNRSPAPPERREELARGARAAVGLENERFQDGSTLGFEGGTARNLVEEHYKAALEEMAQWRPAKRSTDPAFCACEQWCSPPQPHKRPPATPTPPRKGKKTTPQDRNGKEQTSNRTNGWGTSCGAGQLLQGKKGPQLEKLTNETADDGEEGKNKKVEQDALQVQKRRRRSKRTRMRNLRIRIR